MKLLCRLQDQRGQAIIMFIAVFTIILVMGAIAVDIGLWLSERRGSQTDADLAALAGAVERMTGGSDAEVEDSVDDNIAANDQSGNLTLKNLVIDEYCVTADVLHDSRPLFAQFLDIAEPDIGAHAKACVGSVVGMYHIMPVGAPIKNPDVDNVRQLCWGPDDDDADDLPDPLFGIRCDLTLKDATSGEWGWLDLDNPDPPAPPSDVCSESGGGAAELGDEISQGGANTYCRVAPEGFDQSDCTDDMNWCVESKTGAQPQKVIDAFKDLFSQPPKGPEGDCDITGDNIDDFDGTFKHLGGDPGTDEAFYEEICESPRLILLIIIDNYESQGNPLMPIRAFAFFFVDACRIDGVEYRTCDFQGSVGHLELVGYFVNLAGEGDVGWPTDWSPKLVSLVE